MEERERGGRRGKGEGRVQRGTERENARGERERVERDSDRCDVQFNVHPRDGTHIDESLCLCTTGMTVYS